MILTKYCRRDCYVLILIVVLFLISTGSHIYTTINTHEKEMRIEALHDASMFASMLAVEGEFAKPDHIQGFLAHGSASEHVKIIGVMILDPTDPRHKTFVAHTNPELVGVKCERLEEVLAKMKGNILVEETIEENPWWKQTELVVIHYPLMINGEMKGILEFKRTCPPVSFKKFLPSFSGFLLFAVLICHFGITLRRVRATLEEKKDSEERLLRHQAVLERSVCKEKKGARQLEKRLKQSEKMEAIGTLSGGIAHDFNNILGAILGYSDLVSRRLDKDSKEYEDLRKIHQAGLRAKDLVARILTFSRYSPEEELCPVHLKPTIENALELLRASIPSSVVFETSLDVEKDLVVGDETQLNQILINLCTNAAQAMDGSGTLSVILRSTHFTKDQLAGVASNMSPGDYLEMIFSDTGCGMTQEVMDRIFDPFFTTKAPGGGSGLGLSIVHGIVLKHGGMITVSSVVDAGSTFSIYLPAVRSISEQFREEEEIKRRPKMPGRKRILFVDDEVFLREIGKRLFSDLDCDVIVKKNGFLALEEFKQDPDAFDLIVTDQTMPVMTGLELIKEIKEIKPNMPVVLSTGFNSKVNGEITKELDINGFFHKPLEQGDFARMLVQIFGED